MFVFSRSLFFYDFIYLFLNFEGRNYKNYIVTYVGSGVPSASHSIMNGLSLSFVACATLNSSSSVGGCLMMRGGELTAKGKRRTFLIRYIKLFKCLINSKHYCQMCTNPLRPRWTPLKETSKFLGQRNRKGRRRKGLIRCLKFSKNFYCF